MKQDWDEFWDKMEKKENYISRFLSFYRIQIIARSVNYHINRFFNSKGIFVECGAGTSETTLKTRKQDRTFVALDCSGSVLRKTIKNHKIDACINADIFFLPFKDHSIRGIWNVGVMEHFQIDDINKILFEFRRVLENDGSIILFWPMVYAPYEIFINVVEFIINFFIKHHFQFYPDEVSRLKTKKQGKVILKKNKFQDVKVYFNFRDAFSFGVLIGKK